MQKGTRRALSWLFGIFSVIALSLAAAGGVALANNGKIAPNTTVAGVSIGGLTPQQARQAVAMKAGLLADGKVTITVNHKQKKITLEELGVSLLPEEVMVFEDSSSTFGWLTPNYWVNFFKTKNYPISHQVDRAKLLKTVEKQFNLHPTAKNASVKVKDGVLIISPAVSGKQVSIDSALNNLEDQLTTGQSQSLDFQYTETPASVSSESATQTKAEVEKLVEPIALRGDGQSIILTKEDIYQSVDYEPTGSKLSWRISEEKLKTLLEEKVAARLNIAMIQKIIQIKPSAILQQGKDGRFVVINTLVSSVYQRITEKNSDTAIEVPLQKVPYTTTHVTAGYIPDLFDVRYVDINLEKQRMYIVEGDIAIRTFLISSGRAGLPTPKGVFYIKNKIPLAQSRLYPGIWMRYWNALAKTPDGGGYEGYGIHDLPCFDKNCYYIEGASHLGYPISHGCVRLGHENAVWFYEHMPVGTPINIH